MDFIIFILLFQLIILIPFILYFVPLALFFYAKSQGLKIELKDLIAMRFRKCDPYEIVNPAILLSKKGININIADLERHYLAGGHCFLIAQALIIAKENKIEVSFNTVTAIDLSGRNPVISVKDCIKEHILNSNTEIFKSKEGKEYKVSFTLKAKININKIIGGCCGDGQDLINSIYDYIEERITNSDYFNDINPDNLSKDILKENFSNRSVFDIKEIKINIY